ncbi:hypothetical protein A9Q95_13900 [Rhodobacterales bacterium 59_46_T64]|nr:hypothetical protein A9Q95_13900 [Rhodobacterales bacterium 59_46_T64]
MAIFRAFFLLVALFGLASCGGLRGYNGPEVTQVLVYKQNRTMYLLHHGEVLKKYDIGLGFAPDGHKAQEGDGRTPEGDYLIDRRNPNSEFHLSVGINYPNDTDIAQAEARGVSPGGDIFIHGQPNRAKGNKLPRADWTAGCISVRNREIEQIYAMVNDGTPIRIYP